MKSRLFATVLLALSGLVVGAHAQAERIVWLQLSLPPAFIADGPNKDKGFIDLALQKHILPALPGYEHQIRVVPLARRDAEMKANPLTCTPGVFRNPDREKFMVFTRPYLVLLSPGIFVHTRQLLQLQPYLNNQGEVSLSRLLAGGSLRVGVTAGRSYGPALDRILGRYQGTPNLYAFSAEKASASLMRMLLANRVEAVPGFAYESAYFSLQEGMPRDDLHFFSVEEQSGYLPNAVACAKGAQGEAVVAALNDALAKADVRDAVQRYYELWLDENAVRLSRKARQQAEKDGVFSFRKAN